jgi:hypothetical protein
LKPEQVISAFAKGLVQAFLDAPEVEEAKAKKKPEKKEDVRQLVLETIAGLTSPAETNKSAPTAAELDGLIRAQHPPESVYHPDGNGDLDESEFPPWQTAG